MAKAIYYSEILQPKIFEVFGKNEDGTYDIGIIDPVTKKKQLVVGKVSAVEKPKPGFITLGEKVPENLADMIGVNRNDSPSTT